MRRDVVDAARSIPKKLQEAVTAMFDESKDVLRSSVNGLRSALDTVSDYVNSIEAPRGRPGRKPGRKPGASASRPTTAAKKTRRRKKGQFGISEFILADLAKHPGGRRPKDIAALVVAETGKDKKSTSANVGTALYRLRSIGAVVSNDGVYTATGAAASRTTTTTPKPTKAGKAGGRGPGRPKGSGKAKGKGSRTGAFAATEFILQAVKDGGSEGVRPKDIVARVQQSAPGKHTRPSALVSTILARLKQKGQVKKSPGGVWKAA